MIPESVAARYRAAGCWGPETLAERFASVSAEHSVREAIVDGDVRLSFAEIAARAARLGAHLVRLGVRPGDVVSWQLPNWWEGAVVHHAIILAGAISNPLGTGLRAHELRAILDEAAPALLVVPETFRGFDHLTAASDLYDGPIVVARAARTAALPLDALLVEPAEPPPPPPRDPASVAVLLYTSGTTANPKGVQLSHRALLCEAESFRRIHALTAEDRCLGGAPVAHVAGLVYNLVTPFVIGSSSALLERWDPERALDTVARAGATFMTGPPTFLLELAAAARAPLPRFRLFSTGGASIPADAVREAGVRLGCVVKRAYGSTEVPTLTATTVDDDERARIETDGRAIEPAELRIVGAGGTGARAGEEGEIWARAPEMFSGYRNPALHAFEPEGWFRTGDLGEVGDDGLLRVTGRLKDVIIRGGENISAIEVEDLVARHPAVSEAAVIGMPDARLGERVCAVVTLRHGAALTLDELVTFLRARQVAAHKLPERLEIVARFPRTGSGKVDKNELKRSP